MIAIISRLSVYIAAAVILISWLITNSFVRVFDEDTQAMDAVRSEQTQVQQFASLSEGQRALLREMADLEDSSEKLRNEVKHTESAGQNDEADAEQRWVDSFQTDSEVLVEHAEELQEFAERVQPPQELQQSIKDSIQRTKAFHADVQREANAYKQEKSTRQSPESQQGKANAEARQKHDGMAVTFDELNEHIVSLYDQMDNFITEKRERSAERKNTASIVAWVFSALGTVFGALGKWLEKKNRQESPAAT
jgi:DNA repair exonuclease SbcCD ATPase subunit